MLLLLALACARHPPPAAEPGHLTILHTNDMHAHFVAEPADWLADRAAIGGMARLDAEVRALRTARGPDAVLLLDGGDLNTGTPMGEIAWKGATGAMMLGFVGLIGYDAWALGNHEFDKGLDNLMRYTALSPVPVLSANVLSADGRSPLLPMQERSHVFVRNGIHVGVIGATTEGLGSLMNHADFARLTLSPAASTVGAEVARLDPVTDVVVVLSHLGVDADMRLAHDVPGIDLIVGGHSHTRLTEPRKVDDTWIVQAGSYTRSLGVDDLVVSDDHIAELRYELRDLLPSTAPGPADPQVVAMVDDVSAQVDAVYGETIGRASRLLDRSYHHESGLGRFIADVVRQAAGADVGLYNGGGLRADIEPGPVTLRTLYECFPFGNEIIRFGLTGAELQAVLLKNIAAELDEKSGFLPISGVTYTWRERSGAPELVDVKVGGAPLDPARTYTIASNSYVVEQWQKHLRVEPRQPEGLGQSDYAAAVAWVRAHPDVAPPGDPRAVRLSP